jgi:hypothetical protein
MDAQAKEIKNKVMCEIISFAIVYYYHFGIFNLSLLETFYMTKLEKSVHITII